ncbi:MAG: DNA polymerase III subunit delta [Cytophagaceae bacterium]|nr:DNA polymerase III subunit delta [Cytophagaceae bacterium]
MLFRDIPGLESLKHTLCQSVSDHHVAHAQLFHGGPGSGALALALAFATYLNCENQQLHDACGTCASCAKMRKLAHPDVHYIFPVAATKAIKETQSDAFLPLWRTFVAQQLYGGVPDWLEHIGAENKQGNISAEEARNVLRKLSLKAYEGEYKIMVLWQPEWLNVYSANALLKILEEPPERTIFLLVCTQIDKILPTILSRTQRVAVPAFGAEEMIGFLTEKKGVDPTRARQLAYLADGDLSYALTLAEGGESDRHSWFANWMRLCYRTDLTQLVPLADKFDALAKEDQKGTLDYGLSLFRDLFLWQNGGEALVRLEGQELTFVQNFAKAIPPERVERIVQEFNVAYYHLERNVRAKMICLDLSLTLAKLFKK